MERLRKNELTREDRDTINSRVIGKEIGVKTPSGSNVFRAVPTNKEMNSIQYYGFQKHLAATHPNIDDDSMDPPDHTIFIEASFSCKNRKLSTFLSNFITTNLGDNNIRVTASFHISNAKINLILCLFYGPLLMIIATNT